MTVDPAAARRLNGFKAATPGMRFGAGWQSGYAADCKSVYAGSIPASASNLAVTVLGKPG